MTHLERGSGSARDRSLPTVCPSLLIPRSPPWDVHALRSDHEGRSSAHARPCRQRVRGAGEKGGFGRGRDNSTPDLRNYAMKKKKREKSLNSPLWPITKRPPKKKKERKMKVLVLLAVVLVLVTTVCTANDDLANKEAQITSGMIWSVEELKSTEKDLFSLKPTLPSVSLFSFPSLSIVPFNLTLLSRQDAFVTFIDMPDQKKAHSISEICKTISFFTNSQTPLDNCFSLIQRAASPTLATDSHLEKTVSKWTGDSTRIILNNDQTLNAFGPSLFQFFSLVPSSSIKWTPLLSISISSNQNETHILKLNQGDFQPYIVECKEDQDCGKTLIVREASSSVFNVFQNTKEGTWKPEHIGSVEHGVFWRLFDQRFSSLSFRATVTARSFEGTGFHQRLSSHLFFDPVSFNTAFPTPGSKCTLFITEILPESIFLDPFEIDELTKSVSFFFFFFF